MKRKPAKKKAAMQAKPLLELWNRPPDGALGLIPEKNVASVEEIPLPLDFDAVVGFHAGECLLEHRHYMEEEPWYYWWLPLCYDGNEYDNGTVESRVPRYFFYSHGIWPAPPQRIDANGSDLSEPDGWRGKNLDLNERQWFAVEVAMRDAMREGFYLALLRYAEELKQVPEVAAMLERRRQTNRKNAKVKSKSVEPIHKAIRKRFRELRKTVKKAGACYARLAKEYGYSDRTIQRIINPKD